MTSTQAVGWALVHFLWQGALIALVTRALLALLAGRSAATRYTVAVAGLSLMPIVVVGTMSLAGGRTVTTADGRTDEAADISAASLSDSPPLLPPAAVSSAVVPSAASPVRLPASLRDRIASLLPAIVLGWSVGVLLLALRLIGGFVTLRRLVRQGVGPAPAYVEQMLAGLANRLRVRRGVAVLSSTIARVPAVVGWLKPVILIPASALSGLTPAQVEMILAHELAHVRRHDYLVNLLQSVVETLLFYHPGVWWIGARVREEREHCCDDLAVQVTGNRIVYAEALLSLELARSMPAPALAATGGSLLSRVERLLFPGLAPRELLPRWVAGAAVVLVLALGTGGTRLVSSDEPPMPVADAIEAVEPDKKEKLDAEPPQDTANAAPDTVIRVPDGGSLADRIAWARRDAERRNARGYWVAWTIEKNASIEGRFIMGRFDRIGGLNFQDARVDSDVRISGRSMGHITSHGDVRGWHLPGPALSQLVGVDPEAMTVLYLHDRRGARLARAHASSAILPVHFEGRSLYWLGSADDAASVREARVRFDAATGTMREDLVGMIGIHASSALVVPELARILNSRDRADIRAEGAEWLAYHDTGESLGLLARAAREDVTGEVRNEAAEAVGEMRSRESFDTLVVLARELRDPDARREAVESFGSRREPESVQALVRIAEQDLDHSVQAEAVESLGDLKDGMGADALLRIIGTHPNADVRREAVETLPAAMPAGRAVTELRRIIREDRNADVQREAVETLGEVVEEVSVVMVLERIARSHANLDVRREAVETLGDRHRVEPSALDALLRLLRDDQPRDVVREILETLGDMDDPRARQAIRSIGRN